MGNVTTISVFDWDDDEKERVNRSGEGEKPKSELQSIRSRRKPKK